MILEQFKKSTGLKRKRLGNEIFYQYRSYIKDFSFKFKGVERDNAYSIASEKLAQLINKYRTYEGSKFLNYFRGHLKYLPREVIMETLPVKITEHEWKKTKKNLKEGESTFSHIMNKYLNSVNLLKENEETGLNVIIKEESYSNLYIMINKLDLLEKQILLLYFGFEDEPLSKEKIAEKLNISYYKVRTVLNKTLEKLRSQKKNLVLC